jgi:C1A family cysteine protease
MTPTTKRLGWNKPTPEQRIRALLRANPEAGDSVLASIIPAPSSDLSALTCSLDQGQLGSCQSNGPAQALYVAMMVAITKGLIAIQAFVLARLWLYYSIRFIEGTVDQDAGGNIGDAFAVLAAQGVPPETVWPYNVALYRQHPGPEVSTAAYDSRGKVGINYHPISSTGTDLLADVRRALTGKFAVPFGCAVSEAFCSSQPNGTVQAPGPNDKIAGGHCMTVVGHDDAGKRFLIKNSWGDDFHDPTAPIGCFWMAYSYFIDPNYGASDCWIVEMVPTGVGQ